jgi:hypothetical protein
MGLFDSKDLMGYFRLGKNNDFLGLTRIGKKRKPLKCETIICLKLVGFPYTTLR